MIFGLFEKACFKGLSNSAAVNALISDAVKSDDHVVLSDGGLFFLNTSACDEEKPGRFKPLSIDDGDYAVVFSGEIYNYADLIQLLGSRSIHTKPVDFPLLFLELYKKCGIDFLKGVNGSFALGLWDRPQKKLLLARDQLGIEPLYYYVDDEIVIFASQIPMIFRNMEIGKELNNRGLRNYLLFNYNPGCETLFKNVFKLRPAHFLVINESDKENRPQRYWNLSFSTPEKMGEEELTERLYLLIKDSVEIRARGRPKPGIFLSGGMDSSSILTFLTQGENRTPLRTFSYRCLGESFDESRYARIMAEHAGSDHYEIEFSAHDVLSMPDLTKKMSEPFCDSGIDIATHILGRKARGIASDIFTGDGGDELFGGHPVYEADKVSQFVEKVPVAIRKPFFALVSLIPDSDRKKTFSVKLKRFSESFALPSDLLSHRWRTYYNHDQLHRLLAIPLLEHLQPGELYEDVLQLNKEADGGDILSRSLYSDYQTVVNFYLRRNDLNRIFGFQMHFPLLDHRLVQFCASIPSILKVNGWFDTKYIFKKTMERDLPHTIVHRKDKLGHSIPLKNWLRNDREVMDFVLSYISEETVRKRGFFKSAEIYRMIREHHGKKRNNSHRLWSLAVLEMWLQQHYDRK